MLLSQIFNTPKTDDTAQKRAAIHRSLLKKEAEIGGQLFGPIPKGGRREFFCLDEHTWIWHEEWVGQDGQRRIRTTRYVVREDSIIKKQDNGEFHLVSLAEAENLLKATSAYQDRVSKEVYGV